MTARWLALGMLALICPSEETMNNAIMGLAPIIERPAQESDRADAAKVVQMFHCHTTSQIRPAPSGGQMPGARHEEES